MNRVLLETKPNDASIPDLSFNRTIGDEAVSGGESVAGEKRRNSGGLCVEQPFGEVLLASRRSIVK